VSGPNVLEAYLSNSKNMSESSEGAKMSSIRSARVAGDARRILGGRSGEGRLGMGEGAPRGEGRVGGGEMGLGAVVAALWTPAIT
jgi:hypothetical protein